MSLRERISSAREQRAQARARRREQARKAKRAKQEATAAPAAKPQKARTERTRRHLKRAPFARRRDGESAAAKPRAGAKPRAKAGGRALSADARKLGTGAASAGAELWKLGREMVMIPVQLWLAAAEVAGAFVLKAWLRVVRPLLLALWSAVRAALRFLDRHLSPARAVAAVAVVAAVVLAASQWVDYHSVTVGVDAYAGDVGAVAPAPEVESEAAGDAHAWVMVPLAIAALVVIVLAFTGRRRLAALLMPIGLAVIAIAVIVDVPKGLDEGTAAVAYEGADANLLEGFWLQLAAAAALIACGLLLPATGARRLRGRRRPGSPGRPCSRGSARRRASRRSGGRSACLRAAAPSLWNRVGPVSPPTPPAQPAGAGSAATAGRRRSARRPPRAGAKSPRAGWRRALVGDRRRALVEALGSVDDHRDRDHREPDRDQQRRRAAAGR